MLRHMKSMSRHSITRIAEEHWKYIMTWFLFSRKSKGSRKKSCHDIEMIVMTKANKSLIQGKRTLSQHSFVCRDKLS